MRSLSRIWLLGSLALLTALALLPLAAPRPATAAGVTRVGISGDRFTINGEPTFLLGVSYFDARSWYETDLDRLDQLGYNLIRIWLDWRVNGFLSDGGTLSEETRARLLALVEAADRRGMVVDVTILDTNLTFPQNRAVAAVRSTARALAGRTNVLYDLVNEHNHPGDRFSYDQIDSLASALRAVDDEAIYGVSSIGGHIVSAEGQVNAGAVTRETSAPIRARMLLPHMARTPDWAAQTGPRVSALRTHLQERGLRLPIYLQEEAQRGHSGLNPSQEEFIRAARAAKAAGAAAWIFHTDAGFTLVERSFFEGLDDVERRVVEQLPAALSGGGQPAPTPTSPPVPPGEPPFTVGARIEAEDAQTARERTQNGNAGSAPDYPNDTGLDVHRCVRCSNGHAARLHWGERAGYFVRIPARDSYRIRLRARTGTPGRTLTLLLDGAPIATDIAVPPTEHLNDLVTVRSPELRLPAGRHHLELLAPEGMAVDWLQIDGGE